MYLTILIVIVAVVLISLVAVNIITFPMIGLINAVVLFSFGIVSVYGCLRK